MASRISSELTLGFIRGAGICALSIWILSHTARTDCISIVSIPEELQHLILSVVLIAATLSWRLSLNRYSITQFLGMIIGFYLLLFFAVGFARSAAIAEIIQHDSDVPDKITKRMLRQYSIIYLTSNEVITKSSGIIVLLSSVISFLVFLCRRRERLFSPHTQLHLVIAFIMLLFGVVSSLLFECVFDNNLLARMALICFSGVEPMVLSVLGFLAVSSREGRNKTNYISAVLFIFLVAAFCS